MPFRWPGSSNPPVLTTSLIIIALNVVVISFVFTINDVQVPIKPAAEWVLHKLCEFGPIKRVFDTVKNSVGLPDLKLTKQQKHFSTNSNEVHNLLSNANGLPVFTKEQIALFDGSKPSKPVYLAILGRIYDVQKGKKHYAPGGGYHFFAGKDATRAFVTGDFSDADLTDDLSDLNEQELLGILDWVRFYEKDYKSVGVLQGIYYNDKGEPTKKLIEVKEKLEKAVVWKEKQLKETEIFPPCNSEWNRETGGRVWCTTKSGGVTRDWAGVPRQLFNAASKSYRCACVKNFGPSMTNPSAKGNRGDLENLNLKEYEECSYTSNSCKLNH